MKDRQNSIYGSQPPIAQQAAVSPRRRLNVTGLFRSSLTLIMSAAVAFFVLWAFLGHLLLPPALTFPVVLGERMGLLQGTSEVISAPSKAQAQNQILNATAEAEAHKTETIIRRTTQAEANREAIKAAETVVVAGPLQTIQQCRMQLKIAAAQAYAACVGTGVAGGECMGRKDMIESEIENCGALELPGSAAAPVGDANVQ